MSDRAGTAAAKGSPHYHSEALVKALVSTSQRLRLDSLEMVYRAKSGHIGGCLSAAELMACLYFHHLRIQPSTPQWPARDRLVYSKGHASALLYSTLARRGFFKVEELSTFRTAGARLKGHPDRDIPGVEIPAGPLGHGVAIGVGLSLGLRTNSLKPAALVAGSGHASAGRVYVLLGDGELDAGLVWEGAAAASKYALGNLVAIVDVNGVQQTGATFQVMPMQPLGRKWEAFGWHVQEVGGHSIHQILDALDLADEVHAQPSVILARTTKGRGVSFMEYDHRWHGGIPDQSEYELAREELLGEGSS